MKKIPCLYSIVRFMPFVETGEFANVGILLIAPGRGYLDFKLLARQGRVTHFFEHLDAKVYKATMRNVREELERAAGLLRQFENEHGAGGNPTEFGRELFTEIVRPRETVVRFAEPRVVLADDPRETLNELYGYYVERNFVTPRYQETVLEQGIRKWFSKARIAKRFHKVRLGTEEYGVPFPFVEQLDDLPVKVIKPLHLGQDEPTKIIEHGDQWLMRVNRLRDRKQLPEKVLFAVQGPQQDGLRERAYEEVVDGLQDAGVTVLPYEDKVHILEFAAASA